MTSLLLKIMETIVLSTTEVTSRVHSHIQYFNMSNSISIQDSTFDSPNPIDKLNRGKAAFTIILESISGGVSITVRELEYHLGSLHKFFKPQADTARRVPVYTR